MDLLRGLADRAEQPDEEWNLIGAMLIEQGDLDAAEEAGLDIEIDDLHHALGCPVVPMVARRGDGLATEAGVPLRGAHVPGDKVEHIRLPARRFGSRGLPP